MLTRRASLLLPLAFATCADQPPRVYPPLDYSYLPALRLNVAKIDIEQRFVPSGEPPDVSNQDPIRPIDALRNMAETRLKAFGSAGRAVFAINDASLVENGDTVTGTFAVGLDVYSATDTREGFAEARVVRSRTGGSGDLPSLLYDMTKDLMDAMNVELEYQIRRSLRDWLVPENAAPEPVQEQVLPAPPAS